MTRTRCMFALVLSLSLAAIPYALGRSDGAGAGFSGGPATSGDNCTACHLPLPNDVGSGYVELLNAPRRYRPSGLYDMSVRVVDPEQAGAGFSISAENLTSFLGTFVIADALRTEFADGNANYVTQTGEAYAESLAQWDAQGGAHQFPVRWQAPGNDVGSVTFFVAGNAVNDAESINGDRYYGAHHRMVFAVPGDADADTDLDLKDFAALQRCFDPGVPSVVPECLYVSLDQFDEINLADAYLFVEDFTGPTATLPGGYLTADPVRGGLLYDNWWTTMRASAPAGNHPLYPPIGQQAGSVTFRCKECHGWDYKGRDGAYASGSRYTGIAGVLGTTLTPQEIFNLLKADPAIVPHGHDMGTYGMTDEAIWDVVAFTLDAVIDTTTLILPNRVFLGNEALGQAYYSIQCSTCHGEDGKFINFGTAQSPVYVGTLATTNPWEFLHKVRIGHPGSPMPSMDLLGFSPQELAGIGRFSATLPAQ